MSRPASTVVFPARCLALVVFLSLAAGAVADCVRPGDRVLLVSTRPVGCSTDASRLAAGVYAAERSSGGWRQTPWESLFASLDPAVPVVFYVHGNQIESPSARSRGLDVYRRFVRCAEDARPVQFVVFSWCSDKVRGVLRDYREKAARTRPVAWQLAWTIDRLPAGSRVGVLGYSYGARVSSGAAHLLAGGSLSGLRYNAYPEGCSGCQIASMRAVFMAAAYDACWNSPRGYHSQTLNRFDTLLTTVNPRDPAMKYYKWVPTLADPPALGGVGPKGLYREQASRVRLRQVAGSVGRSHDLYDYLAVPGLMRDAWRRLSFAGETLEIADADRAETQQR